MTRCGWFLLALALCLVTPSCSSFGGNRPLNYEDMTEQEKNDEAAFQTKISNTAKPIAKIAFDLIPAEKRKDLAVKVLAVLKTIDGALGAKTNKELIGQTLDALQGLVKSIDKDIRAVAQDAFDLFSGWIDIPNLNDLLPAVVVDRLRAFITGAMAGLEPFTQ